MKWTKSGDSYEANQDGIDFIASRTYTCPPSPIPAKERWTLQATRGGWYICTTRPRLQDCYATAERIAEAMPGLEGRG